MYRLLPSIFIFLFGLFGSVQAQQKPDAAIFLNALPHSGETYISYNLTRFFGLQTFRVSNKTFPEDALFEDAFVRFVAAGDRYLNVGHVPPSGENVALFQNYLNKVFLNLRDPREALVAHITYVDLHRRHTMTRGRYQPDVPSEYFGWDHETKADWQIEHFYSGFINWIDQWLEQIDQDPQLQVFVGTTEEMLQDPISYFKRLVAFYGGDPDQFTEQDLFPLQPGYFHFYREPGIATWRDKLTPEQQERVTALIPASWFERLGWQQ